MEYAGICLWPGDDFSTSGLFISSLCPTSAGLASLNGRMDGIVPIYQTTLVMTSGNHCQQIFAPPSHMQTSHTKPPPLCRCLSPDTNKGFRSKSTPHWSRQSGKKVVWALPSIISYYLDDHVLEQRFEDVRGRIICNLFSDHCCNQRGDLLRNHLSCSDRQRKEPRSVSGKPKIYFYKFGCVTDTIKSFSLVS